jgi:hypothetical protein
MKPTITGVLTLHWGVWVDFKADPEVKYIYKGQKFLIFILCKVSLDIILAWRVL